MLICLLMISLSKQDKYYEHAWITGGQTLFKLGSKRHSVGMKAAHVRLTDRKQSHSHQKHFCKCGCGYCRIFK